MYMKKQENVRYYYMRNIDSATDFVLAYRKRNASDRLYAAYDRYAYGAWKRM